MRCKRIQYWFAGTPTMDRHYPPAGFLAGRKNVFKYLHLILPKPAEFRGAIQPDFSYIAGLGKNLVEQVQLAFAFVGYLWMQA
jgi:hypothetical protein